MPRFNATYIGCFLAPLVLMVQVDPLGIPYPTFIFVSGVLFDSFAHQENRAIQSLSDVSEAALFFVKLATCLLRADRPIMAMGSIGRPHPNHLIIKSKLLALDDT